MSEVSPCADPACRHRSRTSPPISSECPRKCGGWLACPVPWSVNCITVIVITSPSSTSQSSRHSHLQHYHLHQSHHIMVVCIIVICIIAIASSSALTAVSFVFYLSMFCFLSANVYKSFQCQWPMYMTDAGLLGLAEKSWPQNELRYPASCFLSCWWNVRFCLNIFLFQSHGILNVRRSVAYRVLELSFSPHPGLLWTGTLGV